MIITCREIKKSFGIETILENISFILEEKDKAAIVGVNGAGKTTLFKIITGELEFDSGELIFPKDKTIGYLTQIHDFIETNTIDEEMLRVFEDIIALEHEIRGLEKALSTLQDEELEQAMKKYGQMVHEFEEKKGYEYKSRIRGVIKGLGFSGDDTRKPLNQLSGGQKTRVSLGKLLLKSPDLLLLDEPTNHLDIKSIEWLEDYLKSYSGSTIIITHDRYFIDRVSTKIIEIENKKSTCYNGNYSFYAQQKEMAREVALKQYNDQQKEIKKQEDVIKTLRSFNREKSIKRAESREKMLDKMERVNKPDNLPDKVRISLEPKRESGNDVLSVENVSKSFERTLFEKVSFEIKKGEKVALIGPNGIGKTTLFKIILKELEPDSGHVRVGSNVKIGYYDQGHERLDPDKTIFDEILDAFPRLTNGEIRNALAAFVFTGDDVFKEIKYLSGGEKGRVALAKLILGGANFLILDEPTNHLDMYSKEILEKALKDFTATLLYISHDRYFINNTAEKIIELVPDGVTIYNGSYEYYVEKKIVLSIEEQEETKESEVKTDWKKKKELESQERKRKTQIEKIENEIENTEEAIEALNRELTKEEVYASATRSKEVYDDKSNLEEKLLILLAEWEELNTTESLQE